MSLIPVSNSPGAEKLGKIREVSDKGLLSFRDAVHHTYDLFWKDGAPGAQAICDALGTDASQMFLKFNAAVTFLEENFVDNNGEPYARRDFPCLVTFHEDGSVTCEEFPPEEEPVEGGGE